MTYHARVTDTGEIVLPADLARSMGLAPGDYFEVDRQGSDLVLKSEDDILKAGQRAFRATIKRPFSLDDFISDRRAEAARD